MQYGPLCRTSWSCKVWWLHDERQVIHTIQNSIKEVIVACKQEYDEHKARYFAMRWTISAKSSGMQSSGTERNEGTVVWPAP